MKSILLIALGVVLLGLGALFLYGTIDTYTLDRFTQEFPGQNWEFWAGPLLLGALFVAQGITSRSSGSS